MMIFVGNVGAISHRQAYVAAILYRRYIHKPVIFPLKTIGAISYRPAFG
jgi:hypothetical protein